LSECQNDLKYLEHSWWRLSKNGSCRLY